MLHTNHPSHFYSVGTKVKVCVCVCDWYKKCLGWFVCTKAPDAWVIVCLLCMYGAWSVCGLFWCAHHLYSCRCVSWSCVQVRVVFGSSCGWLWTSQQNIVSLLVGYWTLHGLFVRHRTPFKRASLSGANTQQLPCNSTSQLKQHITNRKITVWDSYV